MNVEVLIVENGFIVKPISYDGSFRIAGEMKVARDAHELGELIRTMASEAEANREESKFKKKTCGCNK